MHLAKPFHRFNNWRKSTYLTVIPIFGARSSGDLLQVGPVAILSSLLDRKNTEPDETLNKYKRPSEKQETYIYQDERFDLVLYDWNPNGEPFFDEAFISNLAQIFSGYVIDPLNEKDHAWAI